MMLKEEVLYTVTSLLLITIALVPVANAETPQLVLVANSVDFEMNRDIVDFLQQSFEVIVVSGYEFDGYKRSQRILILGGPDAYEGVGGLVREVLTPGWQESLRNTKGKRNIYLQNDVWRDDQVVLVVAGYDREDTMTVAKEWKNPLMYILSTKNAYRDITPREVNGKMNIGADFVLLDVRTKAEYEGARLEGAVNIPLHEILRRYEELDKDKVIIVYCHSGRRSAIATQMLQNLGFEKVYNMEGGIISWKEEFEDEKMVFPQTIDFTEGKLEIKNYQSARVGDALIRYLEYGGGGCGTGTSYQIFVSRVVDGREIDEGSVWYMDPDLPGDITEDLHEKTDALDDYRIQVKRWSDPIVLVLENNGL